MQPFTWNGDVAYRKYPDGSADLICIYCYRTLVHSADSATLTHVEANHRCPAKNGCVVEVA